MTPEIIKAVAFYIISLCILAIWDFARRDTLWRFASSFLVVAAGTVLFAFVKVCSVRNAQAEIHRQP